MKKPPIGIMPRRVHRKLRLDEIYDACIRYSQAEMEIPQEWLDEYVELHGELTMEGARISINRFQKKTI